MSECRQCKSIREEYEKNNTSILKINDTLVHRNEVLTAECKKLRSAYKVLVQTLVLEKY